MITITETIPKSPNEERVLFRDPKRFARQSVPRNPYLDLFATIKERYGVKTWIELGCGLGVDVVKATLAGLDAYGVDGAEELRPHLLFPPDRYFTADLRNDLHITGADAIGCREVAEHVPFAHSLTLVKNITRNCRMCYFTAAPPGQSGSGHVNCRIKDFWIALFREQGWKVDVVIQVGVIDNHPVGKDRTNGTVFYAG